MSNREKTERIDAELKSLRLNRAHAVVSNINRLLLRERSEQRILEESCRIAVEAGKISMCWIGLVQEKANIMKPAAYAGAVDGYLEHLQLDLSNASGCIEPAVAAVREARNIIYRDIENDKRTLQSREKTLKLGFKSLAVFPLHAAAKVIGTINLYTNEIDFFGTEEIELYDKLAKDISFALEILKNEESTRNLQSQILQTQKIQSIGMLAGGIAHDFNNILGIILAYSSLLERGIDDKKKIKDSSAAITKAVDRGASLVRQILTFARQADVLFQPLNVSNFMREVVSMLEETFPQAIEIRRNIERNIPFISADQTQIHQALLNLCVNARDAMPNGGILSIKAETVDRKIIKERFPAAGHERYVCISVSDTGTGIDSKIEYRIFDPYFTTKEHGKGVGLGLSVVYGVMQTHHGFVDMKSEENKGTTFFLYLPLPFDTARN